MINLYEIKQMGFVITWRMLYLGFIQKKIKAEDIVEYACEQLEQGNNDNKQICELSSAYINDWDAICRFLFNLVKCEKTDSEIENRKIRAVIVSKALQVKNDNYINGLMDLNDLWIELGYPKDSPHIIQGRDNSMSIVEYYTADNYNNLYNKNVEWLNEEINNLKIAK